ncbi:DUF397 domain-containing protein [Streptomyces lavendofoliae]|uniref:DUF397 domain-containing protein n=1 Tax=Streptomyces lavendofoliae TaxID=67314 RepID=UPI003D8EB11A
MTDDSGLRWFTSSYSGGSGTECVECAHGSEGVLWIRDSKRRPAPAVAVSSKAWQAFVTWCKAT